MFVMAWEWDNTNSYQKEYQDIRILIIFFLISELYSGQIKVSLIHNTFIANV